MRMKRPLQVAVALLLAFTAYALARGHHEHLFFALTLVAFVAVLVAVDRRCDFSAGALWGFDAWLALHLLGGTLVLDGQLLYGLVLFDWVAEPYSILRYDQAMHLLCYVVLAILVSEAVARIVSPPNRLAVALIAVLAACGIGCLNEVVEFAAVVAFASTGIGGYVNTALDLGFNLVGAVAGAAFRALRPVPGRN